MLKTPYNIENILVSAQRVENPFDNKVRNPRALGATPGIVGSGGELPTNWGFYDASGQSMSTTNGINIEVIGTGRESGIEYIDINFSGTAQNTTEISLRAEGSSIIEASEGEQWQVGSYIKAVDQSSGPDKFELVGLCVSQDPADVQINVLEFEPTSTLTKYKVDKIIVGKNIDSINLLWLFQLTKSQAYNFTYRFALPEVIQKRLTLDEVKNYLRVDYDIDNDYLESLIQGSIDAFEAYTSRSIRDYTINATWEQFGLSLDLPYAPLHTGSISVTSVEYSFQGGEKEDVTSLWEQIGGSIRVLKPKIVAPGYRLYVTYSVTNPIVPKKAKIGLLKWIASNYEDRQDIIAGTIIAEMPNGSKQMWSEYRSMLL